MGKFTSLAKYEIIRCGQRYDNRWRCMLSFLWMRYVTFYLREKLTDGITFKKVYSLDRNQILTKPLNSMRIQFYRGAILTK